jgi:2-methylaconitate cis-trans-isomerase PrpF
MGLKTTNQVLGYQQIVGAAASTALTVPSRDQNGQNVKPTLALIVVESQSVRWRDDGTDPTASVGMPVLANGMLSYDGDLTRIRFIQTAATATINVTYYA